MYNPLENLPLDELAQKAIESNNLLALAILFRLEKKTCQNKGKEEEKEAKGLLSEF